MKCPECHFENPSDTNFCGKCGTRLHASEEISVSQTKTVKTPIKELTRRTTFAERYEVIEELGRGGMGKVYKVLDRKIKENVALKLLKPEIASDEKTIERFRNELKLARKISHRNVCRMYDLSEEEGMHYITMEYVPGENLKSSLKRMGPLSAGKVIFLTKQICEGLAEAHRLGVVHRDLKPQNIMIDREGNARIMDFGIARSIKSEGITGTGVMIGTPEYMSPEQVEGKEVDQRSDIYSLGIILFEMVTGKVPFEGETPLSIAIMHKSEEPPDPRKINVHIPEDLSQVILRCMEKDREKRYQGAGDLLSELIKIEKSIPTTEKVPPKKRRKPEKTAEIRWKLAILRGVLIGSALILIFIILGTYFGLKFSYKPRKVIDSIAVLPLKNLSGDPEKEYLAERMTGALIDEMTKTGALRRVPPITSVTQYKTEPKRLAEIGKELDVQAVVEWSMLLDREKVQITAKLIDTKKERPLWDKIYERDMSDDLALQSELARTISQEIIVELTAEELPYWGKTRLDVKPKALQLYKKGRFYWNQRPREVYRAREYFWQAVREDSNCALAYAGMADCELSTPYNFVWNPKKGYKLAKNHVKKALEIDKFLGEVQASQAWIKMCYEGDWKEAESKFKSAIASSPNYPTAHQWYANYLMNMGHFEEALKEIERALELDPFSPRINCDIGRVFYYARQFEQAIKAFKKTIEVDPNFFLARHYLGMVYLQKSMYKEALTEFQKEKTSSRARLISSHIPFIMDAWIGITYVKMGKGSEAKEILGELRKRIKSLSSIPYSLSILSFTLGDRDEGFKWLDKAYEEREYRLCLLKIDPVFDSIRSDPRFKEMLKKVGLERNRRE